MNSCSLIFKFLLKKREFLKISLLTDLCNYDMLNQLNKSVYLIRGQDASWSG